MEFGLEFYIVAAIAVTLTGISKAGFGAGIEMMAVPAMALFISPQVAAAIMLPILIAIDAANLWRYRNDWNKAVVMLLLPSAVIGIGAGAMTFHLLSAELLKLGLGIITLAFVALRLLQPAGGQGTAKPGPLVTMICGATSGFTSFIAHAGGPPIKMVLMAQGLPKKVFVGTNGYLFAAINLIKAVPYFFLGQFAAENLAVSFSLLPFVLIGVPLGFWLNGVVSETHFTRIIFLALVLAGVKLIFDGLAGI